MTPTKKTTIFWCTGGVTRQRYYDVRFPLTLPLDKVTADTYALTTLVSELIGVTDCEAQRHRLRVQIGNALDWDTDGIHDAIMFILQRADEEYEAVATFEGQFRHIRLGYSFTGQTTYLSTVVKILRERYDDEGFEPFARCFMPDPHKHDHPTPPEHPEPPANPTPKPQREDEPSTTPPPIPPGGGKQ